MKSSPAQRMRFGTLAGALIFVLCAAGALIASGTSSVELSRPGPGFAGDEACASCHVQQHREWAQSNHHHAMAAASRTSVRAPFAGETATHFGRETRFFQRDGRFFVVTDGSDGRDAEFEVTHTFGVHPLQQYLVPFPHGRLQPLPWAWDTRPASTGGQRWFHLYPDERIAHGDPLHWTGRVQNWNLQCASCHSTQLQRGFQPELSGYATTAAAINVTCEACHGPGRAHVDWARSGASRGDGLRGALLRHLADAEGGRWMLDPAAGPTARWQGPPRPAQVTDMCGACHARRAELTREIDPTRPFLDSFTPSLLEPSLYHADGTIDGEVFEWGSFVQSRMALAGVVCTDCHQPHSARLRAEGNALCTQCHDAERFDRPSHHHHEAGSAGSACVACHMPQRTYMVVHRRHDHSFRVPRPDLSAAIGTPNACTDCHSGRDAAWAAEHVRTWFGDARRQGPHWAEDIAAGRARAGRANERLQRLALDASAPPIARATALAMLADLPASRRLRQTLAASVRDPEPLVRLGAARALALLPAGDRVSLAAHLLSDPLRAVRVEAIRAFAPLRDESLAPTAREARRRALGEFVEATSVNADRPEARTALGDIYAQGGRGAEAEAEYRAALRIDAAFTPAQLGLVEVFRLTGREAAAETFLRDALRATPASAPLHHALGLSLARQRRGPDAVAALARAASLDPGNAQFAYVHALALNSYGQRRSAWIALEAALARHPDNRDILLLMAFIARDAGAVGQARGLIERILRADPEDRDAAQLLRTLR